MSRPFQYTATVHPTRLQIQEVLGKGRRPYHLEYARPVMMIAVTIVGLILLLWPYTVGLGVLALLYVLLMMFTNRAIRSGSRLVSRSWPFLMPEKTTFGISDAGLELENGRIRAKVKWAAYTRSFEYDDWLVIIACGLAFWFQVSALKQAGVYADVVALCQKYKAPILATNSGN